MYKMFVLNDQYVMGLKKATLALSMITSSAILESISLEQIYNNHHAKKFVIGYPKETGMFAALCWIPNVFAWCEKNEKIPVIYWAESSPYFQKEGFNGSTNVWEYYFEPVSQEKYVPGDQIICDYYAPGEHLLPPSYVERETGQHLEKRKKIKGYLDKYVTVKLQVMANRCFL